MKKYKMFVGSCGPHFMYTNIIKADSPEEAARIHLGDKATDEEIKHASSLMREIQGRPVRGKDEAFIDEQGVDISIGATVAFICRQEKNSIKEGKVSGLNKSSITVVSGNKEYRLISDRNDGLTIHKVLVIKKKKKNAGSTLAIDAIGQPIKARSRVAFRREVYADNCKGFNFGKIVSVSAKFATIKNDITYYGECKRRHDYIVVI